MAHGNGTLPMAWIYFPATRMQACMPCLVVILQPGSPSESSLPTFPASTTLRLAVQQNAVQHHHTIEPPTQLIPDSKMEAEFAELKTQVQALQKEVSRVSGWCLARLGSSVPLD